MRSRLVPSGDAYDFHRSLRLLAHRYLADGEPFSSVLSSAEAITALAERNSAKSGLKALDGWRKANPGAVFRLSTREYESPAAQFRVLFTPDFGISLGSQTTAVHIWNTTVPSLDPRMVYAALSLFPDLYGSSADDFAVLSLKEGTLYRLSEAPDQSLMAQRLVEHIDEVFIQVRNDLGSPDAPSDRRPPAG